jgi:hypothetical protein
VAALESRMGLTPAGRALIKAAYHEGPTFRMGFDHHVRAWRAHTRRRVWTAYHTVPQFAAAYDAARNTLARALGEA